MKKSLKKDFQIVVSIITNTFRENPGVFWMFRHKDRVRHFAEFAYIKGYFKKGLYISDNNKGVAICYKKSTKVFSLIDLYYTIKFALTTINFWKTRKILKLESLKKEKKAHEADYLYFWLFAVLKDGDKAGFELKKEIFEYASKEGLPIYTETSVIRNKIVYERFGFETYHIYEDKKENITFWFMKWDPGS